MVHFDVLSLTFVRIRNMAASLYPQLKPEAWNVKNLTHLNNSTQILFAFRNLPAARGSEEARERGSAIESGDLIGPPLHLSAIVNFNQPPRTATTAAKCKNISGTI